MCVNLLCVCANKLTLCISTYYRQFYLINLLMCGFIKQGRPGIPGPKGEFGQKGQKGEGRDGVSI